ncbi:polysaccharide deacetylase [Olsenella sp. AM30-3LB]|uniref:polysaccharide deacetylase family protein n=1 Tax=Atopobiaceae TaxID=1643824 RepID=UPI000E538BD4|nr:MULTISPECIES: polysaccharide deacetylase family protein [unclassified Olsenella]RGS50778.1 polysaccharide deacetylase [Olsenella sp. AF21-51]RHD71411.1 polysaccharide deacetylase [Olsenella sp. AM30-3LB]RHK02459.1 polysaccharide deacetylase [Olsenella sp. AM04-33]
MPEHFKRNGTPRQDGSSGHVQGIPRGKSALVLVAGVLLAAFLGLAAVQALGGSGSTSNGSASSATPAAASDPRAAELALDPNAQTDWSFKNNGEKIVYLTFDDGPSKNTQRVLDILDQYGAKATFFVVGHDPDYYDMIKKAYDDGNTIGLHSYTHDYAKVYASEDAYFDDLDQIAQVVQDQIGYVPYLVRFPGGSSNTISEKYCSGIMDALVNDVQARGYQYYDWNASSGDGAVCTTEQIVENSCAYDDYPNIILLCHDAATKDTTVEALPKIIEHYQALGYQFKAIDRSTMVPHHKVAN